MKSLFRRRSLSKLKSKTTEAQTYGQHVQPLHRPWSEAATQLPVEVLNLIFRFLCPHTKDESYVAAEASLLEKSCMLCDMRDLAHCISVTRSWKKAAQGVLLVLNTAGLFSWTLD